MSYEFSSLPLCAWSNTVFDWWKAPVTAHRACARTLAMVSSGGQSLQKTRKYQKTAIKEPSIPNLVGKENLVNIIKTK